MGDPTRLSDAEVRQLEAEWQKLLGPFGADPDFIHQHFTDLAAAHASAGRHHHTLRHVQQVLETIAFLADEARNPATVRLAAWFHDVIYDARARDNEERSAAHAERALRDLNVPDATIDAVRQMILATRTHQPTADPDSRILLDADLAILGADALEYAAYAQAIRREYAWVPDEQYRAGRTQVLQGFLRRERIYLTESMYQAREARARQNLASEIETLGSC